ncbi:MAG: AAA family ATPase, partial [Bacteroidales bacterium]|nr:AAA family ATPase [Bacteroidales bacterium]
MGRLVNPGNILFTEDLNSKIYVDKSEMVVDLNEYYRTGDKYICVSRARRFGKTMMANLLAAYYSKGCDSRALFEGLKLAQHEGWDKYLNSSNVIYIDINGRYSLAEDKNNFVKQLKQDIVDELIEEFPQVSIRREDDIAKALANVFLQTGESFVFLIDEYDVLIRDTEAEPMALKEYIDLLNGLFKNNEVRNAIGLAYITGILPILKERVQSKLNNFREFTMLDPCQFAPYWGFTEDEVIALCKQFNMDTNRCRDMYDGYCYPEVGHIYNPNSVAKAMLSHKYDSYWTQTSKAEAISFYINANLDGIQEDITELLEGKEIDVNTNTYANDVREFTS